MAGIQNHLKQLLILVCGAFLFSAPLFAQWAAEPGEKVRNGFGPESGVQSVSTCRGACGLGCPSSCKERVTYECDDSERMVRVNSYVCGTHQACRDHDNCLDQCRQDREKAFDCDAYCHTEVLESFSIENAISWSTGGGPYDGPPIFFEYTRESPNAPEPAFRCPDGAKMQCSRGKGSCLAAGGGLADPVFDSYVGVGAGAMRISNFRSGHLCGDSVCQQTTLIRVTGQDQCVRGDCTKYGVEFEYENANPAMPLECTGEVTGGGDFIGNMLKKGADMMPQQGDGSGEDGAAELMGMLQQILQSADTPEDVQITMTPNDEHGNPIPGQTVGNTYEGPASVPRTVDIPAASGSMVVPMYQLMGINNPPQARQIRCSHNGVPVLEVAFQLQY
ncbi:MAG TPA: hypothetical protein VJ984_11635 [Xanthomonadales bacterium]|nr:hypothetical protein [Xanthomonadales bacterium]